jgi:uncharacterized protein
MAETDLAAPTAATDTVVVELAYARPEQQTLLALNVPPGSTVVQVIEQSGLLKRYPEIDLASNTVGIWSRPVPLSQRVQAGDRIEIYRPLLLDPTTTLRQREKAKRKR